MVSVRRAFFSALALLVAAVTPALATDARADSARAAGAPRLLWDRRAGRSFCVSPLLLPGKVILAATDGKVVCLDLADGRKIWARLLKEPVSAVPAAASDSLPRILMADGLRKGHVRDWDPRSGRERWVRQTERPVIDLIARGDRFWILEKGGRVGCRSVLDGHELWQVRFGSRDPAGIVLDDTLLFALARRDSLLALSAAGGGRRWLALAHGFFAGRPLLRAGQITAVAIDGAERRFNAQSGATLGPGRRQAPQLTPPAWCAGLTVTVSSAGLVEAVDAAGAAAWRIDLQEGVQAAPVAADSLVLISTGMGVVHALDAQSGREAWTLRARGGFRAAPAWAGGILLLATDRGQVYAYAK